MTTINKEHEKPSEGNKIIIEIEIGDKVIEVAITCPICGGTRFWLSEDHMLMYCSKCRTTMGYRMGDFAILEGMGWKID